MSSGLLTRLHRMTSSDDRGVALITAVLFVMVATALAAGVVFVTNNNLRNANSDRQALSSLATAEGGVAQAIQVIRTNAPGYFTCQEPAQGQPPAAPCTTNTIPWISSSNPEKVSANGTIGSCVTGLACYAVWIATLHPFNPSAANVDANGTPPHTVVYRIHSTGLAGNGPSARSVVVDVSAKLATFPLGLYGDNIVTNGTPTIQNESIFSKGCITNRSQDGATSSGGIAFNAYDPSNIWNDYDYAYDLPQAAHAAGYVTTTNGCSSGQIHSPTSKPLRYPCAVDNTSSGGNYDYFPFDQDGGGAALPTTSQCYNMWTSPVTGKRYPSTSLFTMSDLYSSGYRPQGLSPGEYNALKNQAQAMGSYFQGVPSSAQIGAAMANITSTNGVVYIDAQGSTSQVTLKQSDIPARYFRANQGGNATSCPLYSVTIVVRNGQFSYNGQGGLPSGVPSNYVLVASFFVPEGTYTGGSGTAVLGTLYAQTVKIGGGQSWALDQCFVNNPPSLLLNLKVTNYREVDTQNIN
jgi:hypothetical protein